jgi:ATP-binding cassette, subfamily B, multidrug efflux pump
MHRNKVDEDESIQKEFTFNHFLRLFKYIKPYKAIMSITIFITLVGVLITLTAPFVFKIVVDISIPNEDVLQIITLSFVLFLCSLGGALISKYSSNNMSMVGQGIIKDLREDVFKHLQKLPFSYFDNRQHGKILARLVDNINSLSELLSKSLINIIADLFTIVFLLIIMLSIDVSLTIVSMAGLPILFATSFFIERKARLAWQLNASKQSNLNAYIHESIIGAKTTQSFVREQESIQAFDTVAESVKVTWIHACKVMFTMQPTVQNVTTFTTSIIYIFSVRLITGDNPISTGTVIAFTGYMLMFWKPITNLANVYNNVVINMSYIERIFEILDEPVNVHNCKGAIDMPTIKGDVEFRNITFSYDDEEKVALDNISFTHKAGSSVALVGPTGAGKSTIVNLLSRFYVIKSGQILVDNIDITKVKLNSLRSQMGIMLQDCFIFAGTIMENIRYGNLLATDYEVIEACKVVNVHDFIMNKPKAYKTLVNERGNGLSLGEKQLISLARVILANPKILILDEATSSIDTNTELVLQKSLERVLQGRTSFIIAHRLSTIKNASCIMYIDKGKVLESGTHQELLDKKGYYYKLYNSQYTFLTLGDLIRHRN